jgi:hypothetical protein
MNMNMMGIGMDIWASEYELRSWIITSIEMLYWRSGAICAGPGHHAQNTYLHRPLMQYILPHYDNDLCAR